MREITSAKIEWRDLFDPDLPNQPYLLAALSGTSPGIALVDGLEQPTMCIVRSPLGPTFSSRSVTDEFLSEAIRKLRSHGDVGLIGRRAPVDLQDRITTTVERMEFTGCDLAAPQLQSFRDKLPRNTETLALTKELMKDARCGWEIPPHFHGDVDQYLEHGYGVFLMRDGEILCEAYTSHVACGLAEINVATPEAHRRQGFALLTSAFMAEEARKRGHGINWSCNASNAGSIAIARRLGFRSEQQHLIDVFRSDVLPKTAEASSPPPSHDS